MDFASLTQTDCELIRRYARLLPESMLDSIPDGVVDEVVCAVDEYGQFAEHHNPKVRDVLDCVKTQLSLTAGSSARVRWPRTP
jgi:hypothetical protein